jgi:hypothetical protein
VTIRAKNWEITEKNKNILLYETPQPDPRIKRYRAVGIVSNKYDPKKFDWPMKEMALS